MLTIITTINDFLNGIVWGWPAIAMLVFTGILLTCMTGFFQISHFRWWWKHTVHAIFKEAHITRHTKDKSISQFQSLCTALAATVATGNIVGVAGAIAVGGPGAVLWMILISCIGMITNFSEIVLGILYRRKNAEGEWNGGAMYYLKDGLGAKKKMKTAGTVLSVLFAVFCLIASFGIGNMSQVNSMAANLNTVFGVPAIATGIFLLFAVSIVIFGGLKRVSAFAESLAPFMVLLYLGGSITIILMHASLIPDAFSAIFRGAFGLKSAAGGVVGAGIAAAMNMGMKRGVFSNEAGLGEAGLGSSVMIHSGSNVIEPVRQGMWGIFEVFVDTIMVCSLTAFVILTSGAINLKTGIMTAEAEMIGSSSLVSWAFSNAFGQFGAAFVALAILLFAYSSSLGWSHYGSKSVEYLFGTKAVVFYRIIFSAVVLAGVFLEAKLAWSISDTFNGLMMLPNLIGVIVLAPLVSKCTKNYIDRRIKGIDEKPFLSVIPEIKKMQEEALLEGGED